MVELQKGLHACLMKRKRLRAIGALSHRLHYYLHFLAGVGG